MLFVKSHTAKTISEALTEANMLWNPVKRAMIDPMTGLASDMSFGIFRDDTQQQIGAVGAKYVPVPHLEQMRLLELLVPANRAKFVSVGEFKNGARIFAQIGMGDIMVCGVDQIEMCANAVTSHDGSLSISTGQGSFRIVCHNTYIKAHREGQFKIRHTSSAADRIAQAIALAENAQLENKSFAEKLETLANRKMTKAMWDGLQAVLYPAAKADSTHVENNMANLVQLFELNDNGVFPQFAGTLYAAFQAVTNDATHATTGKGVAKNDLESLMIGTASKRSQAAFDYFLKEAKTAEIHTPTSLKLYGGAI